MTADEKHASKDEHRRLLKSAASVAGAVLAGCATTGAAQGGGQAAGTETSTRRPRSRPARTSCRSTACSSAFCSSTRRPPGASSAASALDLAVVDERGAASCAASSRTTTRSSRSSSCSRASRRRGARSSSSPSCGASTSAGARSPTRSSALATRRERRARPRSRSLRAFGRMYRPHAAREDTVLFPAFRDVVGRAAYRELGEQFEEQGARELRRARLRGARSRGRAARGGARDRRPRAIHAVSSRSPASPPGRRWRLSAPRAVRPQPARAAARHVRRSDHRARIDDRCGCVRCDRTGRGSGRFRAADRSRRRGEWSRTATRRPRPSSRRCTRRRAAPTSMAASASAHCGATSPDGPSSWARRRAAQRWRSRSGLMRRLTGLVRWRSAPWSR